MTAKNDAYNVAIHRMGRLWCSLALLVMLGVPAAICVYFNVWPPMDGLLLGLFGVITIYLPVAIIEVLTYAPMMGAGSSYLMFVTGNLTNLKVPCALNAIETAGVKPGSRESEIVATIATGVSAIVTDVILIIGVVGLSFIQPFLENPVVAPAFANVLPALFGALGVVWLRKYWKVALVPSIIMLAIFIFLDTKYMGLMIPVAAIIAIIVARILYKKGRI